MQDCTELDVLTLTTTVGSVAEARAVARALVDRRLAACVQVEEGLVCVYHWAGRLCEEAEVRLTIKSLPDRQAALLAWMAEHHPYDVPQFTAWTAQASPGYAAWVRAEITRPPES